MFKELGQITSLLKDAQTMQSKFKEIQSSLAERCVEGSAGGGMVTVTANGRQEIISLTIDPELWKSQDVDMLQDLVLAAVNQAIKNSQKMWQQELGKMSVQMGINLPGLG
jgi:DNA-binding YbaB/EbfC family protein